MRVPLESGKCHLSWQQTRSLPLLAGNSKYGNHAVLQSTAPGNALVEANPSEAGALNPLLYTLATRGFSPIASDPSLGALKAAYRTNISEATERFVEHYTLPRSFAVGRSLEIDMGMMDLLKYQRIQISIALFVRVGRTAAVPKVVASGRNLNAKCSVLVEQTLSSSPRPRQNRDLVAPGAPIGRSESFSGAFSLDNAPFGTSLLSGPRERVG